MKPTQDLPGAIRISSDWRVNIELEVAIEESLCSDNLLYSAYAVIQVESPITNVVIEPKLNIF